MSCAATESKARTPEDIRKMHASWECESGSDGYRRSALSRRILYTSGVERMAEQARAYWLIDLIVSHQPKILRKHPDCREFQAWKLTPRPDRGPSACVAECFPDSGAKAVVRQFIEYTDFPFCDGQPFDMLWVEGGAFEDGTPNWCILLKSEH